jgi:hypothetical protein
MAKAKSRFLWGVLILIIIFGVDAAAGNQLFNALWQIGVVLVDGALRLLNAILSKLSAS